MTERDPPAPSGDESEPLSDAWSPEEQHRIDNKESEDPEAEAATDPSKD